MSLPRLLFTLLLAALVGAAQAAEEILEFASELQVDEDGALAVTETLRVRAEGDLIRRGIYRDFPTEYRDRLGQRVRVAFDVESVARDGEPEPFRIERRGNGVRVWVGQADVLLRPGDYEYRLRYRTDRQLGFFAQHDELYWNVTGNGWEFPIRSATAMVRLPEAVPADAITVEAYTGPAGAQGRDWTAWVDGDGVARFETTHPLGPHEGLTVVARFPKGHVREPTDLDRAQQIAAANPQAPIAVGGSLLTLGYFLVVWWRFGRDPTGGPIVPLYSPPRDLSPAAARFVRRMGYDQAALSAALVSLAVKGALRIEQDGADYVLEKLGGAPGVAADEAAVASALFGDGRRTLTLERANHAVLTKTLEAHRKALDRDYEKTYFVTNSAWLVPGILLGLGTVAATVLTIPEGEQRALAGFMSLWLSGWSVGVFFLVREALLRWRQRGLAGVANAIGITLFAVPFVVGEIVGLGVLLWTGSVWLGLALLAAVGLALGFYQWLKAPTLAGRRLMDAIEGFALYLGVAEADELAFRHPPERTPALFERYFPYALALGVELAWAERFADVLARAQAAGEYDPRWYTGHGLGAFDGGALAGALGSGLAGAIAASSTAPGSSSGSGGGGSSGGGGGGGGGGGW
jgi:uncharacterized membrane protein YgcG